MTHTETVAQAAPRRPPEAEGRSGTVLALGLIGASAALVAFIVLASPGLREQALDEVGGSTDRDVIASGTFGDEQWVVASTLDADGRSCVVVELDDSPVGQTCAAEDPGILDAVGVVTTSADKRWFLLGATSTEVPLVRVDLVGSDPVVLRPRGGRTGFGAGYYATLLPPGAEVSAVTATDVRGGEQAVLRCDGPVATSDGATPGCDVADVQD